MQAISSFLAQKWGKGKKPQNSLLQRLNITDANKERIMETIIKSTLETRFGELEGNLHFLSNERSVLASFVQAESARAAVD